MNAYQVHPDVLAQVPEWTLLGPFVSPWHTTPWVFDQLRALKLADSPFVDLKFLAAPLLTRLTLERCTIFWALPSLLIGLPRLCNLTLAHNRLTFSAQVSHNGDPAAGAWLLQYASTLRTIELLGECEWRMFLDMEWHLFTQLESLVAGGAVYCFVEETERPGHVRRKPWTLEGVTLRMPESLQSLTLVSRNSDKIWKTRVFFGAPSSADLHSCSNNVESTLTGVALGLTEGQCSKLVKMCKREDITFLGTDGEFYLEDFYAVGLPGWVEHPSGEVSAVSWRCKIKAHDGPYTRLAELAGWEAWAITSL